MSFLSLATGIINFLNMVVVPVLFSVAAFAFLFGVFKFFFWSEGDESARKQGKAFVMWGLVGLAVMFSTWGLVNMLLATFAIQ